MPSGATRLVLPFAPEAGGRGHLNLMPFEAAAQMEKNLAEDLRRAGYTVTGGH